MKLFFRSFIVFIFFVFFFGFFTPSAFSTTTPFRSANIITTDGRPSYTNLGNCSVTDGQTCDRALVASYANLYFSGFGSYSDFGMSERSVITKLRVRVTGKSRISPFALIVGISPTMAFSASCINQYWVSDPWILWHLNGLTINSQNIAANVLQQGDYTPGGVFASCLKPSNFVSNMPIFRLHASTAQIWSANIDNFEIAFDYESGATPTPTPTPTPRTPLILIPGIGGSELKVAEDTYWLAKNDRHGGEFNYIYPKDEIVWLNEPKAREFGDDDYFDVLRIKADGITSEANIETTGNLLARAYQGTIDFFIANDYVLNKDLFVFPYDWRRDISLTASLLDQKINSIKQQTGSEKVDIVSHSMGGLVARSYISDTAKAQNVRKLFTLGTPHLGAVKSLKALMYGDCLTIQILQNLPICSGLINSEVKDVLQNMISGFELAPSQTYFNFYSGEDNQHPFPYRTESGDLNYTQIKNLLTNLDYNTLLFIPSEIFHNLDNSLANTNGVDVTIIAGSGIQTLGQIIELNIFNLNGNKITYKDQININGDGTVPLLSASIKDPHKDLFLNGLAKVYYTNQEHGGLVSEGPSLNLVKNILADDSNLPAGVSETPYKMTGYGLSVHSPVNMYVYDSFGNHTGPTSDGDFEANILGSSYDALDDAKFIWLPDDGQYDIKFEATDQGSFDFKIRKYEDDENSETILYKEIPLINNTKGEVSFDTQSLEIPIIRIDNDGDGNFDFDVEHFSILRGDANHDRTSPTILSDVNPKSIWPPNNKMVDIGITGAITDENPYLITILVDDEYNLIEPSITIQNQTDINQIIRLEASRRGDDKDGRTYTIKILATDLAGNTSLSTAEVIVPHDRRK